jgi:hypothetical protein
MRTTVLFLFFLVTHNAVSSESEVLKSSELPKEVIEHLNLPPEVVDRENMITDNDFDPNYTYFFNCRYTYRTTHLSVCNYKARVTTVTNPYTGQPTQILPSGIRRTMTYDSLRQTFLGVPKDPNYRQGAPADQPPSGDPLYCDSSEFTQERFTTFFDVRPLGTVSQRVYYTASYFLSGGSDAPQYTADVTYDDEYCFVTIGPPGFGPIF